MIYIYFVITITIIISVYEHYIYTSNKKYLQPLNAVITENVKMDSSAGGDIRLVLNYPKISVKIDGEQIFHDLNDYQRAEEFIIGEEIEIKFYKKNDEYKIFSKNGYSKTYYFSFVIKALIIFGVVVAL